MKIDISRNKVVIEINEDSKTTVNGKEVENSNSNWVEHPNHYCKYKNFETIQVIKIVLNNIKDLSGFDYGCLASVIKYIDRYGSKWETTQELDKARQYLKFMNYNERFEEILEKALMVPTHNQKSYSQMGSIVSCFFKIGEGDYNAALNIWKMIREDSENNLGIFNHPVYVGK